VIQDEEGVEQSANKLQISQAVPNRNKGRNSFDFKKLWDNFSVGDEEAII
jgi:hypothetical protein